MYWVNLAHKADDRSSVVTDKSFITVACKLRAIPARRFTLYCHRPVFRGALETYIQPTASAKPPVS
ncbi:hypothetical protein EMIT0194MI4_60219 [Pseudomonas sp. IT-194MI4]